MMTQQGKAGKKANLKDRAMVLKVGPGGRAQRARTSRRHWTMKLRAAFLNVLKESCNVREAARSVGMSESGAYDLRRRDAGFAAEWAQALEQGYAELEMLLLRQAIYGAETTETIEDHAGSGATKVKTVHSYPQAIALRLLLAHKGAVDAYREEQGIDRPGSDDVRAEIQRKIEQVRAVSKQGDTPPQEGGDAGARKGGREEGGRRE